MTTTTDAIRADHLSPATPEHFETVIIGGGQAGLAVGHHLARQGRPFLILDSGERIGEAWLSRWDSMRLFTPAVHDGLPGMPFPAPNWSFPTRAEMAAYLEEYATRFELPVRHRVRVDALSRRDGRFMIAAGDSRFEADQVVLACGSHQRPRVPAFAPELDPGIVQMHSGEYRNPSQLQAGDVLLVGAGNSGADIALELAAERRTLLSGRHPGHIPFRIEARRTRMVFPLIWFTWSHVLTLGTPIGRKARPKILANGDPLIRVKPKDLNSAGVERVARTAGVRDGRPELEDGTVLDVANVIWCTGFRPDLDWIDLPGLGGEEEPDSVRGVVESEPGLYVIGQEFLYAFNSHTIGGVGRDASHIARQIAARRSE